MDTGTIMREDWNKRARENARWYIASDVKDETEFIRSGAEDARFILRNLDPDWLIGARTLEIGCGAGRMTAFLLLSVGTLYSIDVSTEMIRLAASRLGYHPDLHLMPTSGTDLSLFDEAFFDLVLCYVVLQHIPDSVVKRYFREIHRVLRHGGVFRGQVARFRHQGYVEPGDTDTFSMRSWEIEEIEAEFSHWQSLEIEAVPIDDLTDHLWITARK